MIDKNHMNISIDVKKTFDKVQVPFMIKNTQQSRNRGSITQHNKSHIWETDSQHHTQQIKTKSVPPKSRTRQECQLSPLLFNIVLEVLATAIRQEKQIKVIQIGKEEVKLIIHEQLDSVHRKLYRLLQKSTLSNKWIWQNSGIQRQYWEIDGIFVYQQ